MTGWAGAFFGAAVLLGVSLQRVGSHAPGPRGPEALEAAGTALSGAARDTSEADSALRFQHEVIRLLERPLAEPASQVLPGRHSGELGRGGGQAPGSPIRTASLLETRTAPTPTAPVGTRAREEALRRRLQSDPGVDWEYLEDFYSGRVSGIPSETRAGATLQEIDAAGEVPYFERLRQEGDYAELSDLDLPEQRNLPLCRIVSSESLPVCSVP